jgi:hypothetical protein
MSASFARTALLVGLTLLCGGCNSGAAGGADGGEHDTSTGMPDAHVGKPPKEGGTEAAPPIRTATTRSLLPTSVQNLLLDPFLTGDESWGHFRAIIPPPPSGSLSVCQELVREYLGQSPAGVSGPAVLATASTGSKSAGCTQILAPFPGVTSTATADMWISLSDAKGAPLPFPTDAHGLDAVLEVTLLPNYLPTDTPQPTYGLESKGAPTVIAGREWGQVALAAPAPLTKGGWFSITLVNLEDSFYFAAPEVVPTDLATLARPRTRPMTGADRSSIGEYERVVRLAPRHPPRPAPGR